MFKLFDGLLDFCYQQKALYQQRIEWLKRNLFVIVCSDDLCISLKLVF